MLITKTVMVKWNGNNRNHFESKGYIYTSHNSEFVVKVEDLTRYSKYVVDVLCDYCLEMGIATIVRKNWSEYVRSNINCVVHKDCCAKCQQTKTKECNLINFGVESKTELEETRMKMRSTMMDRYGVEYNMQIEEVKNKAQQTFIQNYGFNNPMKNKDIIAKATKTTIDRFGSKNTFTNKNVLKKAIETNLRKYGAEWHMQNKEVMRKSRETMYKNGTAPCSKQQLYLYELFGGKLNYPVDNCSLDIAFPDEKIYIEYDGNGHNLSVKLDNVSQYEFDRKEIRRYLFLKSQGWKQFRIVSPVDYLPSDDVLIGEFIKAKEWFEEEGRGHSHYIITIGNKINDKNYGVLRRIKEEDLIEIG